MRSANPVYVILEEIIFADPTPLTFRQYVLSRMPTLAALDPQELLITLFTRFGDNEAQALMAAIPEVWGQFDLRQWNQVFTSMPARPSPRPFFAEGFSDVRFFMGILRLSPFPILRNPIDIGQEDMGRIAWYCDMHAPLLVGSDLVFPRLNGISFCSESEIEPIRRRLIAENVSVEPAYDDADGLREYIERLVAS